MSTADLAHDCENSTGGRKPARTYNYVVVNGGGDNFTIYKAWSDRGSVELITLQTRRQVEDFLAGLSGSRIWL